MRLDATLLLTSALAIGCAGKTAAPLAADASVSDDAAASGAADAATAADASEGGAAPAIGCPSSQPIAGADCPRSGLICEYGSQLDYKCNSLATCSPANGWVITPPSCTLPDAGGACPASMSDFRAGTDCPTLAECDYDGTRCACTGDGTAESDRWECEVASDGCPLPRPKIGSLCSAGGECDYASCTLPDGIGLACFRGIWQPILIMCGR